MPKAKTEYLDLNESGNWNVAKPYAHLKIMKWLSLVDEYETIARFGTSELTDEFIANDEIKKLARLKALDRLAHGTTKLINNTKFAVKKKDKEKLMELFKDAKTIEKLLPLCKKKTFDQRNKKTSIRIDDKIFEFCLNKLEEINTELLEPLNHADLIFTSVEDWDPDKIKEQLMHDMVHNG